MTSMTVVNAGLNSDSRDGNNDDSPLLGLFFLPLAMIVCYKTRKEELRISLVNR